MGNPISCMFKVMMSFQRVIVTLGSLRTFAPKSSHAQIFLKLATQKGNDLLLQKRKKMGGHRLRFGKNMPRKIPQI